MVVQIERRHLMKQANEDMQQLIAAQSRTAAEKAELEAVLQREAEDKRKLEQQKEKYLAKLKVCLHISVNICKVMNARTLFA